MKLNHTPGSAELTTSHTTISINHADGPGSAAVIAGAIKHRVESYAALKNALYEANRDWAEDNKLNARILAQYRDHAVAAQIAADERHSRQIIAACIACLLAGLAIGVTAMWGMLP